MPVDPVPGPELQRLSVRISAASIGRARQKAGSLAPRLACRLVVVTRLGCSREALLPFGTAPAVTEPTIPVRSTRTASSPGRCREAVVRSVRMRGDFWGGKVAVDAEMALSLERLPLPAFPARPRVARGGRQRRRRRTDDCEK